MTIIYLCQKFRVWITPFCFHWMMEEIHYKTVIAICQDSNVATYTQLRAHSIDFYSTHVINKENFTHKKNIEIIKVESIQAITQIHSSCDHHHHHPPNTSGGRGMRLLIKTITQTNSKPWPWQYSILYELHISIFLSHFLKYLCIFSTSHVLLYKQLHFFFTICEKSQFRN